MNGRDVTKAKSRRWFAWLMPNGKVARIGSWLLLAILICIALRGLLGAGDAGGSFTAWAVFLFLLDLPFLLILLFRLLNRRLLWKVRNRLILTYVLMALAPLVLFGTLAAVMGYGLAGQFSINSALSSLDEASNQLKSEASTLSNLLASPAAAPNKHSLSFEQNSNPLEGKASVAMLQGGVWRNLQLNTQRGASPPSPFDAQANPAWLSTGFHGIVLLNGKLYLCSNGGTQEDGRNADVLSALELNPDSLSAMALSLGRMLIFSGFTHALESTESEARSAEQEADQAETEEVQEKVRDAQQAALEAQRDSQEQIREAQRESQQQLRDAQLNSQEQIRDAQRGLDQAQREMQQLTQSGEVSQADKESAQKQLSEAQDSVRQAQGEAQQAMQHAEQTVQHTVPAPTPPSPPEPPVKIHTPNPQNAMPNRHRETQQGDADKGPIAHGNEASFTPISGGVLPPASHFFDPRVYFTAPLQVVAWSRGAKPAAMLVVISRPSLLYARLFSTSADMGSFLRYLLIGITIIFGLLELLALWMATRLSRTITSSVANLYRGTTEIDNGNLDYRVRPDRQDQLGALATSFNRMAGSIQDLLVQQREKERLLSELAIAQEVQRGLFPHSPVSVSGLELHAVCVPARSVSGDYFDFIFGGSSTSRHGSTTCIALGDISGKGISAALLMASLHSAVRAFSIGDEDVASPARLLDLLNRHLYHSTTPEKYATLFLAFYDAKTCRLTYSNAGHLPPLILAADGSVQRLEVGGSVVGLLDNLSYEEATVQLKKGDLLAAYSDGLTEPEKATVEFGEGRLLQLLLTSRTEPLPAITEATFRAVHQWIGEHEQPDDMTLLLARQI